MPTSEPPIPTELRLTFEQFSATGRDVEDVNGHIAPSLPYPAYWPARAPGRAYAGGVVAVRVEPHYDAWLVTFENGFEHNNRLEVIERDLYAIYVLRAAHPEVALALASSAPAGKLQLPAVNPRRSELRALLTSWLRLKNRTGSPESAMLAIDPADSPEDIDWLTRFSESWARADDESAETCLNESVDTDHPRYESWRAAVAAGETMQGLYEWARD